MAPAQSVLPVWIVFNPFVISNPFTTSLCALASMFFFFFLVSVVHVKRFAMSVEMELYGFTIPFQLYAGFLLDFSHFGCRRFLALACYQSEVSADLHIYIG